MTALRCDLCGELAMLLVRCLVDTAIPRVPGGTRTAERLICLPCLAVFDARSE